MKNDGCILPAGCSTIGVLVMGASFSSSTANKLVLVHQLGVYITAYENIYSIPVGGCSLVGAVHETHSICCSSAPSLKFKSAVDLTRVQMTT